MTTWFAVYTRARAEAMAREHLRRQGYEVYLPQHMKRRRHARRTDFVPAPLFPRYLFVSLDRLQQRWRPILSTFGVCDLVRQGDWPAQVPAGFVEELRARERDGAFDHPARLQGLSRETRYGSPWDRSPTWWGGSTAWQPRSGFSSCSKCSAAR